jgi:hypothetical protein
MVVYNSYPVFQYLLTDYMLGKEFRVYGPENMLPIHSFINTEVSDLPASRKIEGLVSFSSKLFMCPQCETPSFYLADPRGFNPDCELQLVDGGSCLMFTDFKLRDPWRYAKYAFRARSADGFSKKEILERHGVSWSVLNDLPGWLTSMNSVVEFMHCIYLCKSPIF